MDVERAKASYTLTLDELCTKEPPHSFLHNGIIYVDILWCELTHEGLCYGVVAHGAATCTSLLGSTMVTPVTRVPPHPFGPPPLVTPLPRPGAPRPSPLSCGPGAQGRQPHCTRRLLRGSEAGRGGRAGRARWSLRRSPAFLASGILLRERRITP